MLEEEWSGFKEVILEVGEEVCRTRRIREGMRTKGSECWSEEIRRVVETRNASWCGREGQGARKILRNIGELKWWLKGGTRGEEEIK